MLVGGASIDPSARVRRYHTTSQLLEVVPVDPALAPADQVLGAAYDYVKDLLYVLDVENMQARLVEHALESGTSRQIWEVPFNGRYASHFLGQADNGHLVLVVTDLNGYTAWSIDVFREEPDFTGRLDGDAPPVSAPVLGAYSLTMPVLASDGIQYVELAAGTFEEGAPCTEL